MISIRCLNNCYLKERRLNNSGILTVSRYMIEARGINKQHNMIQELKMILFFAQNHAFWNQFFDDARQIIGHLPYTIYTLEQTTFSSHGLYT